MSNQSLGLNPEVYQYLLAASLRESEVQRQLRDRTSHIPESEMQIAPEQGQFMQMLIKLMQVRCIIEVGTFTGHSALSMAMALPDNGQLICCDINKQWTEIARQYWQRAGVENKIELMLGDASESLSTLLATHTSKVDMIFIDADKENYLRYFELGLSLLRPGGLMLIDNVLWSGLVADPDNQESTTQAIREFNDSVYSDDRVDISMLPLADGLTLAMKKNVHR
jgi:caffeoyl-CoA O-methyltransferase